MAPFVSKKKKDPDYEYYKWEKSHNSKFYKKTRGVLTSTKEELQRILRTTPDTSEHTTVTKLPVEVLSSGRESSNTERQGQTECTNNNIIGYGEQINFVLQNVEAPMEYPPGGKVKKRKRKKKFSEGKKQNNFEKYSSREVEREIARNTKRFNEKIQVELLKSALGNPWDEVFFNEKKRFALHFYFSKLQVINLKCIKKEALT